MDENARDAALEAVVALGHHSPAEARTAMAEAVAVDPSLGRLADAVYLACAQLEADDGISDPTWNQLADAAGPGPIADAVEQMRG